MASPADGEPEAIAVRLNDALNTHDLEAFVSCFHKDYESRQPAHPDRAFRGREQVRQNWSEVFAGVPDFKSELLGASAEGDTVWSEWHWRGSRTDGTSLEMAGVIVCGVRDGQIAWARLYVEPVEQTGAGIDAAVQRMSGSE